MDKSIFYCRNGTTENVKKNLILTSLFFEQPVYMQLIKKYEYMYKKNMAAVINFLLSSDHGQLSHPNRPASHRDLEIGIVSARRPIIIHPTWETNSGEIFPKNAAIFSVDKSLRRGKAEVSVSFATPLPYN